MTRPTGHFTWWALVARNVSLFIFLPFIFIHKKIQQVEREHRSFTLLPCLLTDEHKCFCFCRFARPGPAPPQQQHSYSLFIFFFLKKNPPSTRQSSIWCFCIFGMCFCPRVPHISRSSRSATDFTYFYFFHKGVGWYSVGRSVGSNLELWFKLNAISLVFKTE